MTYSTITTDNLKKLSLTELKQERAHVHSLLVESDGLPDKNDPAIDKALRDLNSDLEVLNREIWRKEGMAANEAERRAWQTAAAATR